MDSYELKKWDKIKVNWEIYTFNKINWEFSTFNKIDWKCKN